MGHLTTADDITSAIDFDDDHPGDIRGLRTDVAERVVKDATQAREAVWNSMNSTMKVAEREGRDLNAAERRSYTALEGELDKLDELGKQAKANVDFVMAQRRGVVAPEHGRGEYRAGKPLTRDQSVQGYIRSRGLVRDEEADLSLGKYLRGMATGDWKNADAERRAMAEGAGAGGGFLVPTLLSAQIIDRVRNQTRVLQAGATVVPMENRTLDVARWEGDPSAAWHSENAAIPPSDATLGKVTLTAQALAANVEVSWELLEDAPNVEAKLGEAFASVFANRIDLAALYGTGTSPEPRGVKSTTAVAKTPLGANGAALTNYDPLIDSAGRLYDANVEPTGIIYSGRTARSLSKLKATDNQPLNTPEYIAAIPRYATQQVPNTLTVGTGTTTSDAFTADWRQLLLGVRTQLVVKVLAERYADNGQTGFIAWWRGDIAVARPAAFDVVTGVL